MAPEEGWEHRAGEQGPSPPAQRPAQSQGLLSRPPAVTGSAVAAPQRARPNAGDGDVGGSRLWCGDWGLLMAFEPGLVMKVLNFRTAFCILVFEIHLECLMYYPLAFKEKEAVLN